VFIIASDELAVFGILSSRFHEVWARAQGNRLGAGNQGRYNATRTFQTFPFPDGLTLDLPGDVRGRDPKGEAIATAAGRLNGLRENWLNPPDIVERVAEVVSDYPDRVLPRDAEAATELRRRTLTNLYNDRPHWLANAHAAVDAAVAAAYGWETELSEDALTDADILTRLLALNQQRSAAVPAT
jgi:type II restriction/modification system DNA methylase subunit YeeA